MLKKKKTIILALLIEETNLWPELSSPPCFRFQGGYPERQGRTKDGLMTEILVSNILSLRSAMVNSRYVDYAYVEAL